MNAHQRRIKRRSDERKREEENRKLIEKFKSEGKSYCVMDGKVVEVEVDVLDKVPLSEKRMPVTITVNKEPAQQREEPFHVSNKTFQELVLNLVKTFGTNAP